MEITLNGRKTGTECRTAYELRDNTGNNEDVVILNGFQIAEDCSISENDVLTIIRKGVMPDEGELESMMMARHTPYVHRKVKQGSVAVAGLGGLGSNIAVMLARTGVGRLLLVDFDTVEPSNLNRQNYFLSHLGMSKTDALRMQIEEINPFISVETRNTRVRPENVEEIFSGYDIVCEAFDRPEAKSDLVNTVLLKLPCAKVVAASGMAGYGSSNAIRTVKSMGRMYLCGDLESEAGPGSGLMSPRVHICAGHQANMILRLLLGIEDA
jgi:sulfur carrier protein ThiS adenylyltransferase